MSTVFSWMNTFEFQPPALVKIVKNRCQDRLFGEVNSLFNCTLAFRIPDFKTFWSIEKTWYPFCSIRNISCLHSSNDLFWKMLLIDNIAMWYMDGILPKGPYPPCLHMADRALLAGYPRYECIRCRHVYTWSWAVMFTCAMQSLSLLKQDILFHIHWWYTLTRRVSDNLISIVNFRHACHGPIWDIWYSTLL